MYIQRIQLPSQFAKSLFQTRERKNAIDILNKKKRYLHVLGR
jgi:hypothetical protein